MTGNVWVQLVDDPDTGHESRFAFRFSDAATGEPLDELSPYQPAPGHVVMPADGSGVVHEHAEVEDDDGQPVFALPGQRFGTRCSSTRTPTSPASTRSGGQFRLVEGTVITVPYTVEAH